MGDKILYKNAVGVYVLNDSLNIIENDEAKEPQDQQKISQKLAKKYTKLRAPTIAERQKIVEFFSSKKYIKQLKETNMTLTGKAIKESVKEDQLIIQSARLSEELEKELATLGKRLREWAEHFYPRTSEKISDHAAFAMAIFKNPKIDDLGAKPSINDKKMINDFAKQVQQIYELKNKAEDYAQTLLKGYAPNFFAIAGAKIGSKLLIHAGSIEKLSKMPASTIQLLGAEQALFRHLKNKKSRPPKYGILHEHPLVLQSKASTRGKVARVLADKISIALKVDFFKGKFIGDQLLEGVKKRFSKDG